ncbi:Juvenile hormone epoxide hydrolase 1-like protein [Gryllus bimaculatus]|nr:Juvenile hormone epoxide hydrolase 1-like protein [Gryllus bimaculatus]
MFSFSVLGFHTNTMYTFSIFTKVKMFMASFYPSLFVDEQHYNKAYPVSKHYLNLLGETGYFHIQATKPDTVGIGLRDSPAGLAAYVLEKFSSWTNMDWRSLPDGGLQKKYSLTNLLDNVMIYWVTGSITTSIRIYSETFTKHNLALRLESVPCVVPTAMANFPNEPLYIPEAFVLDKFPELVQFSHLERGGHFPAFEEPKLLADDIWAAVEKMRKKKR